MTNPYPLPRETRETAEIMGDGRDTYGPFGFRIWNDDDVVAYVSRQGGIMTAEAILAAKSTPSPFDTFSVTFVPALLGGDAAIVMSRRLQERSADVIRGGSIAAVALERELSVLGTIVQELRRDVGRALALAPGNGDPDPIGKPIANKTLIGNATGTGFAYGPDVLEIGEFASKSAAEAQKSFEAAQAAVVAQGIAAIARDESVTARNQSVLARDETLATEGRAQALVDAANAGWLGVPSGNVTDEGYEGPYDGPTYFNNDEGYE